LMLLASRLQSVMACSDDIQRLTVWNGSKK
jgi:hypothetical protein